MAAAALCESAGADGITAHLREDRRHIQDADVEALATHVRTFFNLETACIDEMIEIALRLHPPQVTLVPERRQEITTEGGLDVTGDLRRVERSVQRLREAGIRASLFIDPSVDSTRASRECGADAVEFHTGRYAHSGGSAATLEALAQCAALAAELGLAVHAGHGLSVGNVAPVAAVPQIEELNIGHSIVSRSVFVGLPAAVREMRAAMDAARRPGEIAG